MSNIAQLVGKIGNISSVDPVSPDRFKELFLKRVEEEQQAEVGRKRQRRMLNVNRATAVALLLITIMYVYAHSSINVGLTEAQASVASASGIRDFVMSNPTATGNDIIAYGTNLKQTLMTTTYTIGGINVGSLDSVYENLRAIYPDAMDFFAGKVRELIDVSTELASMPTGLYSLITKLLKGNLDINQLAKTIGHGIIGVIVYIIFNIGKAGYNIATGVSRGATNVQQRLLSGIEDQTTNMPSMAMSITTNEGTRIVSMGDVIEFINSKPAPIVSSLFDTILDFFFAHQEGYSGDVNVMSYETTQSQLSTATIQSVKSVASEGFFKMGQGDINTISGAFGLMAGQVKAGLTFLYAGIVKMADMDEMHRYYDENYFNCVEMSNIKNIEDKVAIGVSIGALAKLENEVDQLPDCLRQLSIAYSSPPASPSASQLSSYASQGWGGKRRRRRATKKRMQNKKKRTRRHYR